MKEGKVFKRVLAIALVVVMTITMMPFGVFATDGTGTETPEEPVVHVHDYKWVPGSDSTCITAGTAGHYKCKTEGCDKVFMSNADKTETTLAELAKPLADHTWNAGEVTTEPTCATKGVKTFACTVDGCEATRTEEVEKLTTHTWATEFTVDEAATCTKAGSKSKHCTVAGCTAKTEETEIPAGHKWAADFTVDEAATCTEAGSKSKHCTVAGCTAKTEETEIPAGHKWATDFTVDEAATCTEAGSKSKHCTVAGCTAKTEETEIPAGHKWATDFTIDEAATCTEAGSKSKHCTVAGCTAKTEETEIPAAHKFESTFTVDEAATCTKAGSKSKHCSVANCEEKIEVTEIEPLPHTEVIDTGFAATCLENGKTNGKHCSVCNTVLVPQEVITAPGHGANGEFTNIADVEATCTTDGYKAGKYCKVCNTYYDGAEVIEALGHTITNATEYTVDIEPTCTTPGRQSKHCTRCTFTDGSVAIDALGHDTEDVDFEAIKVGETTTEHGKKCKTCGEYTAKANHAYNDVIENKLSTCVTKGLKKTKCVCGETKTEVLDENDNHDWGEYKEKTPATCTEVGSEEAACKRPGCTDKDTREIPAAGHKMTKTEAVAATCKDAGNIEFYTCSVCNKYFKDEAGKIEVEKAATVTPATNDHKFTKYSTFKDETCTANRIEKATCDICKEATHERVVDNTMLAHTFENYKSDGNATCKVDGTMTAVCEMCKEEKDTKTEVDSHKNASHTPDAKGEKCTVCGEDVVCRHTYSAKKLVTKTPTCTEKGQEAIVCSKCKANKPGSEAELAALGHAWDEGEIIKDATCSEKGSKKLKCNNMCGETKTEEIAVKPHNYKEVITHATCTEAGYSTFTCTMCGSHYVDKPVEAYGHMFETYFYDEGSATCYQDGTKTAECANGCGTKNTVADPGSKTDHEMTDFTVITPATCTEDGEEEAKCFYHEKCGYSEIVPVEALGHDESGEFVETLAATCTTEGSKEKKCARCSVVIATEAIPALGHDETAEFEVTVAPTCTEKGTQVKKCKTCSEVIATEEVAALGHDIAADYTIDVPATCTTEGSQSKHCSRCDYKDGVVAIPASGHDMQPGEGTTATCTEPGKAVFVCANGCGKTHEEANVPALGHSFTYTSNGDATCQADGTKTGKCIRCDVTETVADEGSMLEHVFGEPVIDKASTEKGGLVTTKCTNCEYEEVEEIAMIDSLKLKYETVVYDGKYKRPSLTITDAEGAKLIKGEDYLLELPEKDECINAGTYTYTVTFIGNYEGEATLTYKVVPGKASKIVSKGTKQTYIDLKWSTVKGADGYRIYVKTSSGGWKKLATVKGKTTYRVKDLKAGTNYTFAVKAFSKAADGETTIWATEFAEQAFKTLPGKTSKLTAKTSKNAVKLTWKEVKGAEGYRVYVKTAKGGWKTVATVKGGKVTYTVKELKANTTYEYAVKAFYKDGSATVWSNQFTTVKAKTAK